MASRALVASLWSFAGNWGQQLASVVIFLYLVRTLDAVDFGVMALAAAFIDVMTVFGRFGQVEALLQRRKVTQRVASTSFWLLFGIGVASLVMFALGANLIGDFFDDPRIAHVVLLLSPVPLVFNLTQVHEYFLRADFQYKSIALRNVIATLVSGLAAAGAAYLGYGFYALVLQKLVFTVVYAAALAVSYRWRPSFTFFPAAAARLSNAGFDVVVANIINMLNPRIVDVFVGYYLGVAALGFLRIAWRLFDLMIQFVFQPIVGVSISSLTAVKGQLAKLQTSFINYFDVLTLFAVPIFIGTALIADEVIRLAAGEKWASAVIFFRLLCLSAIPMSVNFLFSPLMIGLNRTRTIRNQALFQIIVTTATMYVAAQIDLIVVLVSHIARVYLFAAINLVLIKRYAKIEFRTIVRRAAPAAVGTLAMVGTVLGCRQLLDSPGHPILHTATFVIAGALAYAAVLLAGEKLGAWPKRSQEIFGLMRSVVGRRKRTA